MPPLDRRQLIGAAAATAAGLSLSDSRAESADDMPNLPDQAIDSNVSLFHWPFRHLKLDDTGKLVAALRARRTNEAWAGSFEAILHRDVAGVNRRLADACHQQGDGILKPVGAVNLSLPDWEEDLRRCHENHAMIGIRLLPSYHGYDLADDRFGKCLAIASKRGLLVQIAAAMEDVRTQHPLLQVGDVDLAPLSKWMNQITGARVLVLNYRPRLGVIQSLAKTPGIYFDTSRVDSTDGVSRLLIAAGKDRVLLGSHAPFLILDAPRIRLLESTLTQDQINAVARNNARRLIA